jgi:chromosome segregation ATPase
MSDGMRTLVDTMRADVARTHAETSQSQTAHLALLGEQMRRVSESLQNDVQIARASQEKQIEGFTRAADEATRELTVGVRSQTEAIEQATAAMRAAVADLNTAVTRNIDVVGQGAAKMEQAAGRFSTAGNAVSDVLDRSNTVTSTLSAAATTLSQSSREVHAVLSDYRDARDRFATLVAGLETTIETARRDAATTSDLVEQLRQAAQVMNEAQRSADEYMGKVTGVLAGAHESFAKQMAQTVGTVTTTAHQNLGKATNMLAETVQELDDMLSSARRSR